MRRNVPPVWLCLLLLVLALCWRMLGAPLTAEQFENLHTPLWQMRVQLPSRMARVFSLWHAAPETEMAETPVTESTPVSVYLVQEGRLAQMTLEGYICGVVAAEMPAQYHMEALKAQAVAARTRVLKQMENGGCSRFPGADVCTDSAHCQGYASLAECRERWQDSFDSYRERIHQAQSATKGEVLTYEGEMITVLYHAISGGRTEDAATVFSQSLPYLVSVESQGEEQTKGYWQETQMSYEQIAETLSPACARRLTAQEVRQTLTVGGYTESGRVESMLVAGERIKASDFRRLLQLRSTWFSLSMDETGVTFQQRGYGHGVGMSQAGANSMAASGRTHAQILGHYYTGTVLEKR